MDTTHVVIITPPLAETPADAYMVFSGLDSALVDAQQASQILDRVLARLETAHHPDADRVRRIWGFQTAIAQHLAPLVLDWAQRMDAEERSKRGGANGH